MLVDSHCHLDANEFDADRDAVIARARTEGVGMQVLPAVDAASWPDLMRLCTPGSGLFAAYGLHPMYLDAHRPAHVEQLRAWIERERPVAVGECGLDYFVAGLDRDGQARYFDAQLQLAREFDLPVIIHARRAVDAVIAAVRKIGGLRGVVHSFPGSPEQARQLGNLGFLLGIGGPVTYARANRLRSLVASMPIDWLLLETDAPDQPDSSARGERNEPARLRIVCDTVAGLRGEDFEAVASSTTANARRLFALP